MLPDKELSPDDPILNAKNAPFEMSAVLRMHRGGVASQEIMRRFKLRGTQLIKVINDGNADYIEAVAAGREIHQAYITNEVGE